MFTARINRITFNLNTKWTFKTNIVVTFFKSSILTLCNILPLEYLSTGRIKGKIGWYFEWTFSKALTENTYVCPMNIGVTHRHHSKAFPVFKVWFWECHGLLWMGLSLYCHISLFNYIWCVPYNYKASIDLKTTKHKRQK